MDRSDVTKDAQIVSVRGEGWFRIPASPTWVDAEREQVLTAGDFLRTGDFGRMGVLFADGVQIKLNRKTTLEVKEVANRSRSAVTRFFLELGEVWSRAKTAPESIRVETPAATAAIRGTDWVLEVDEQGTTYLTVIRGSIDFFNTAGSLLVAEGQQAMAEVGRPPVRTFVVQPSHRVQWVFSYPLAIGDLVPFATYSRSEAAKRAENLAARDAATMEAAGALFDSYDNEASARMFDRLIAADPDNARALTYRGLLALRASMPEEAERLFDAADAAVGNSGLVATKLGRVGAHLQLGRIADGVSLIESLLSDPNAPAEVGVVGANVRAWLGEFSQAEALCRTFGQRFPDDPRFMVASAGLLLVLDDADGALRAAEKAVSTDPQYAMAHTVLGNAHQNQGRGAEALAAYNRSLEIDPRGVLALNGLALLRGEQGFLSESEVALTGALEGAPDSALLRANRAFVRTLTEKLGDARDDYVAAAALDPSQPLVPAGMALLDIKEGNPELALENAHRASLLENRLATPHVTAAIAYYQSGRFERALQELELATQLDARDPYPYLVAYLIYQDLYKPYRAIEEARQVLERLPYLKSVDAIENNRQGQANLGSALLSFGLAEWSESYAQESYNPHNASSHFQSSRRYNINRGATVSELVQGLLLDPMANSQPTRFQDIIRRPRTNLSVSGTWGDEDGAFSQDYTALAQGYLRLPWEFAWSVALTGHDSDGSLPNSDSRIGAVSMGFGLKPDYQNGFTLGINLSDEKAGEPGSPISPDPDDRFETSDYSIDFGYRRRFGPRNNLLLRAAGSRHKGDFINPAPFGTGLTDTQTAFLLAGYGLDETRGFFAQGVYDVSATIGPPTISLATDSTGTVADFPGSVRLPGDWPEFVDTDLRGQDRRIEHTRTLQMRHMIGLDDRHEFTWGADYVPLRTETLLQYADFPIVGTIDFYEEPVVNPDGFVYTFPGTQSETIVEQNVTDWRFFSAYVGDRWKARPGLLVEGNLFFESFEDDFNDTDRLLPRIGAAWEFLPRHLVRGGFQSLMEKSSLGSLAPVSTAGLLADDTHSLPGAVVLDYQLRWEARWTDRFFSAVGLERSDIDDPELGPDFTRREFRIDRATVALNAIVTREVSAFVRYVYSDGEVTGGGFAGSTLPRVPEHLAGFGAVWTSPRFFSISVSQDYTGRQVLGLSDPVDLPGYWTTSLSGAWEPLSKRVRVAVSVTNLFNSGLPAPARGVFLTLEGRL